MSLDASSQHESLCCLGGKFKFGYDKGGYDYRMFFNGTWLGEDECVEFEAFRNRCYENMAELYKSDPGTSIYEAVDENSKWAAFAHYWLSLMHSNDPDQVAVSDAIEDNDTHEDWPVRDGYGALIAQQGDACPVQLNTVVEKIDWSSSPVLLHTNDGIVSSDHVVITVSTGVLGADQIEFTPELPIEKQEAIHALPLGNSNYQFFSLEERSIGSMPRKTCITMMVKYPWRCGFVHLIRPVFLPAPEEGLHGGWKNRVPRLPVIICSRLWFQFLAVMCCQA